MKWLTINATLNNISFLLTALSDCRLLAVVFSFRGVWVQHTFKEGCPRSLCSASEVKMSSVWGWQESRWHNFVMFLMGRSPRWGYVEHKPKKQLSEALDSIYMAGLLLLTVEKSSLLATLHRDSRGTALSLI